jgi:ribosomal protein S18 acetylase RimI-like enzyme
MSGQITIHKAELNELNQIVDLFSLYREFYGQQTNTAAATAFIKERISNKESVIFLAEINDQDKKLPVGFVQLYPSFSSVSMKNVWILNDLFVKQNYRKMGIGKSLINKSIHFAAEAKAKGLTLCTAYDNYSAQKLYEKIGFTKNESFYYYCYNF